MDSLIYVLQVYRNGIDKRGFPQFKCEVIETYAELQDAIDGVMELWMEEETPNGFMLIDNTGKPLASLIPQDTNRAVAIITFADGKRITRHYGDGIAH